MAALSGVIDQCAKAKESDAAISSMANTCRKSVRVGFSKDKRVSVKAASVGSQELGILRSHGPD
jgi:hypothetical protein